MIVGELYPGGPLTTPAEIDLGGHIVTLSASLSSLDVAYAIAYADWGRIVPGGLESRDRAIVKQRLRNKRDGLTRTHTDHAAILVAIRMCGIETGIRGYRAAAKLCGTLIGAWPQVAGLLSTNSIDPSSSPLWQVCAVMYRLFVEPPEIKNEDRVSSRISFYAPLPREPKELFEESGERVRVVTQREASNAWYKAKSQYDALMARTGGG